LDSEGAPLATFGPATVSHASLSQLGEVALCPLWRIPVSSGQTGGGGAAGKRFRAAATGTFRFIPLQ